MVCFVLSVLGGKLGTLPGVAEVGAEKGRYIEEGATFRPCEKDRKETK